METVKSIACWWVETFSRNPSLGANGQSEISEVDYDNDPSKIEEIEINSLTDRIWLEVEQRKTGS